MNVCLSHALSHESRPVLRIRPDEDSRRAAELSSISGVGVPGGRAWSPPSPWDVGTEALGAGDACEGKWQALRTRWTDG